MKIVHTSDWHAGLYWRRQDRTSELQAALESMVAYIDENEVDLVLMSGDIFDNRSPSGRAERLVANVFRDISRTGATTIAIAGNHDSPTRLQAWRVLGAFANVHIVHRPCAANDGGVIEVRSRDGSETAIVAAIPFASAAGLVPASVMANDDSAAYQRYSARFAAIVEHLSGSFRGDTVNIVMAHTHMESAILARSEREVHTGEQWAAQPQCLPVAAHYVALGHIHKPQKLDAPAPTYYAGSPMQLDFGELGEEKTFNVVECQPGLPAKVTPVPYRGGLPLRHFEGSLDELAAQAAALRESCWLRARITLSEPNPDIARQVRALVPNAVIVQVASSALRPQSDVSLEARASMSMRQLFRLYLEEHHEEKEVSADALLETFTEFYTQATE